MKLSDIKLTPLIETLRFEDISDEEYFSKKYSNYISNSRLSLINPNQNGNPDKFFNGKFNNYSDSLLFGSFLHQLVLQPESFFLCTTVDRPTGKTGYIADEVYDKSGKVPTNEQLLEASKKYDYYKSNITDKKLEDLKFRCYNYWRNRSLFEHDYKDDKYILYSDPKNRERITECITSLNKDKNIQDLLHPSGLITDPTIGFEKTILLDILIEIPNEEPFILKFKSKLDHYSIDLESNTITVNDLKTTGRNVDEFNDALMNYHYYREMAVYSWLLSLCANKFFYLDNPTITSNFLVVSTIPAYRTRVVPMNKKLFMLGFNEFKKLFKLVAYYVSIKYKDFAKY